ncbi:hypothetical protein PF001_g11168 [Phytophthora fragariae]|uniref:Uncharacterized protein n=2 Tax=Phytophthora fragariae TaxID=53985 RepID=A0A6A3JZS1_9STRA|nr:hypothetical protein PF011_g15284 [Phytophthora fragariae]KAE9308458.1 hypothetical protein PF001_g11168 [Phytophthora fragariae]KAE9334465.1 hypothetical protein PF008_g13956 [Phytophthora fragariae]
MKPESSGRQENSVKFTAPSKKVSPFGQVGGAAGVELAPEQKALAEQGSPTQSTKLIASLLMVELAVLLAPGATAPVTAQVMAELEPRTTQVMVVQAPGTTTAQPELAELMAVLESSESAELRAALLTLEPPESAGLMAALGSSESAELRAALQVVQPAGCVTE